MFDHMGLKSGERIEITEMFNANNLVFFRNPYSTTTNRNDFSGFEDVHALKS